MEWRINQQQEPVITDRFNRPRLTRTLIADEGSRGYAYRDDSPARHWTIGVGHLIENPISEPTWDLS